MKLQGFLAPQDTISQDELRRGTDKLMWDAAFASGVGAVNSGVVLAGFALHLGAPNTVIGMLAAAPFWTQLLQAPTVAVVERLRTRRRIAVLSLGLGRIVLLPLIVLPFLHNPALALTVLIAAIAVHYALNSVAACAWNSWIRDLIPEEKLGDFFARRSSYVAVVTLVSSLGAGVLLDWAKGGNRDLVFAVLYAGGFLAGAISTLQLARAPEPSCRPHRRCT